MVPETMVELVPWWWFGETDLHIGILESIASRLCLPDYYVFRSVCTSWRHVSLHRPCPLLMFPRDPTAKTSTPRGFFCVQNKKIYQIPLPRVVVRSWCCGSSHGWLIMAHKTRGDFLFNPFSSARIQLPTHPVLYDWIRDRPRLKPLFITKAILSAEPTLDAIAADRCVVAAMFDNKFLAFCRPGDQKWTWTTNLMEDDGDSDDDGHIDDDDHIEDGDSDVDEVDGDNDGDSDDADDVEYQKRLLGIKTLFKIVDEKHEDELDVEEEEEEEEGDDHCNDDDEEEEEEEEEEEIDGVEDVEEESNNIDNEDEDEEEVPTATYNVINDIIFHKGKLYAITQKLEVYVCEFVENGISKRILQTQPLKLKRKEIRSYRCYYLVESCCGKELLMVVRVAPENDFQLMTKKFIVFKLNYSNDPPNWVRVENIGDQVLFLGQNRSESISATDFPPASVQGNCICYSDDLHNLHLRHRFSQLKYKCSCMFSLDPPKKGQSIEFFPKKYPTSLMVSYPHSQGFPPVWITPNP